MVFVPVTNSPRQTFWTTIAIDGVNRRLKISCNYNKVADYWELSLADGNTDEDILVNVPMLRGVYPAANILEPYTHLGLGSAYLVPVGDSTLEAAEPSDETLNATFFLVWGDTPNE